MDAEDVRLAVYRGFACTGRAPDPMALAEQLRTKPDEVRAALRQLADAHHLVLDDSGEVVMAHPFSAVPLGFAVMGAETLWWGGCAWDSFALPHIGVSRCPGSCSTSRRCSCPRAARAAA
jgi:hypothetical protein